MSPGAARAVPAFIILAAVVVYLNSLGNGFAFDDIPIIVDNARVHDLSAWRDIWLTPYWPFFGKEFGLYRPLSIFLYAVQWAFGGGAPWVFHSVSVLLHALAALLAFLLLDRLTGRVPALVGALVFAVHPVHTEAVSSIVGQAEVVASLALLGAALVHVSRPTGAHVSWPRRLALIALFAIGITAKESAVVLPALLVALDFAQRRVQPSARGVAQYAHAMLLPLFLLGATLALYLIFRFEVLSGAVVGLNAGPALPYLREEYRVLNALRAFPEFLRLLVFPQDLAVDYGPAVILPVESATPMTLLGALLLLMLTGLALSTPWLPGAGLPAAWFLLTIMPVSNLFFPIGVLIAERTLYAPSLALGLAVAFAWRQVALHASASLRRVVPAVVAAAVVLLAGRTWVRNDDWESTDTVAARFSRDHPESYRVQWRAASLARARGQTEEADLRFRAAHQLHGREPSLLLEYGVFLLEHGRAAEAVPVLERSWELRSFDPAVALMLARAYIAAARWQDALARSADVEAFGIDPVHTMPLRAHAWAGLGQHDRAAAAWRVAHRHAAINAWIATSFLARSLAQAGYPDEAARTALAERQRTDHPGARRTLERVAAAIRSGCYDSAPPSRSWPACDPLGDYFTFSLPAADSAVSVVAGGR